MSNSLEQPERDLEQSIDKVEQLESEVQQIDRSLEQIEQTLDRLESKGDQEIADSVRRNLEERKQERTEKEQEARQIMQDLESVRDRILDVDKWNNEAHQEIRLLEQVGENVGVAAERIADRAQKVEEMESRYEDAKGRLRQIVRSSGYA